MNYSHLLEAGMLVCFGFSWPLNVIKAYKARTAKGTSLAFIILIITGYIAGISAKILNKQFNYVLGVYFINLAIVMMNVFVYIRNKALDKKALDKKESKITKLNIEELVDAKEDKMLNYSNSLDDVIYRKNASIERQNAVILLGGAMDKEIPVSMLAKEFDFNFDLYNKSDDELTLSNACDYFNNKIAALLPEGILLHLGEKDVAMFMNDSNAFDNLYLGLIAEIKKINEKCRIALISVSNPNNDKTVSLMNAHIKAIAEAEKVSFVNIENAKLWNPEATRMAADFAYSMGLRIRKPLRDVAEILYSYAYKNIEEKAQEIMVG